MRDEHVATLVMTVGFGLVFLGAVGALSYVVAALTGVL